MAKNSKAKKRPKIEGPAMEYLGDIVDRWMLYLASELRDDRPDIPEGRGAVIISDRIKLLTHPHHRRPCHRPTRYADDLEFCGTCGWNIGDHSLQEAFGISDKDAELLMFRGMGEGPSTMLDMTIRAWDLATKKYGPPREEE